MNDFTEKRKSKRVHIQCDLHFKAVNSEEFYEAWCIDLSATGISFISDQSFEIGVALEAHIFPEPPVQFNTKLPIKVVRCNRHEDGTFEVGACIIEQA